MHFSTTRYGAPVQEVVKQSLDPLSTSVDSWKKGRREAEINQTGVYVHRFNRVDKKITKSFQETIDKIEQDKIPTPCTLIGPSFSRTYNHYVWEGCPGLMFSPEMPIVLDYKGDVYSARLSNSKIAHVGQAAVDRNESLRQYTLSLLKIFNSFAETSSAFKARKAKKLNLIVNAEFHRAKLVEIRKRGNFYFSSDEIKSEIDFDRPSKKVLKDLVEISAQHGINVPNGLRTNKDDLISFIESWMAARPDWADFLSHAKIKIQSFGSDQAVRSYWSKADEPIVIDHLSSYRLYLAKQFKDAVDRNINIDYQDPSTVLSPNEVLGMPKTKDLIGIVIDPSLISSFNESCEIITHLGKIKNWEDVSKTIPPYLHVLSHLDGNSIVQLGWSTMVLPYTNNGLEQYCNSGKIKSLDDKFFRPDYFLLLHRIAAASPLVFEGAYNTVDIIHLKRNVVRDICDVRIRFRGRDNISLINAASCSEVISAKDFELFCFLELFGVKDLKSTPTLNIAGLQAARSFDGALDTQIKIIDDFLSLDINQLRKKFIDRLSVEINRIESKRDQKSQDCRRVSLRSGWMCEGKFLFNPAICCLSLFEGVKRSYTGNYYQGIFSATNKLNEGGASLVFGTRRLSDLYHFGIFFEEYSHLKISQKCSKEGTIKNLRFYIPPFELDKNLIIDFPLQSSGKISFANLRSLKQPEICTRLSFRTDDLHANYITSESIIASLKLIVSAEALLENQENVLNYADFLFSLWAWSSACIYKLEEAESRLDLTCFGIKISSTSLFRDFRNLLDRIEDQLDTFFGAKNSSFVSNLVPKVNLSLLLRSPLTPAGQNRISHWRSLMANSLFQWSFDRSVSFDMDFMNSPWWPLNANWSSAPPRLLNLENLREAAKLGSVDAMFVIAASRSLVFSDFSSVPREAFSDVDIDDLIDHRIPHRLQEISITDSSPGANLTYISKASDALHDIKILKVLRVLLQSDSKQIAYFIQRNTLKNECLDQIMKYVAWVVDRGSYERQLVLKSPGLTSLLLGRSNLRALFFRSDLKHVISNAAAEINVPIAFGGPRKDLGIKIEVYLKILDAFLLGISPDFDRWKKISIQNEGMFIIKPWFMFGENCAYVSYYGFDYVSRKSRVILKQQVLMNIF